MEFKYIVTSAYFIIPTVGVFLILILWKLPIWQVKKYQILDQNQQATLINEYRKTLTQIIGGIVILLGLYFTGRNIFITQEGQITERFTRAVNQLGNNDLAIRLGGIYALERIAKDSKKDHPQIIEILTAFMRKNPYFNEDNSKNEQTPNVDTDIQAVLTVIGRRNVDFDAENQLIDLHNVYIVRAYLNRANLQNVIFAYANLQKVVFLKVNLNGAMLTGSNLRQAWLGYADLQKVSLKRANLEEANLIGTNLRGVTLKGANLKNIQEWDKITDMTGADISDIQNAPDGFIEFAKSKGAIIKDEE